MSRLDLIQGNEACALGAIKAGVRFFAGYPITPSSEIAEIMARELPKCDGIFIQMEDEMGSLAAAIGARLAGKKAMTATSGPGFSLMQEHIGFAVMAETPVVVVNVMRGGPSTGLPTMPSQGDIMQARWGTHGDHPAIAFAPKDINETFWFTVEAVNTSEKMRMPVFVLMDEVLSHMREPMEIPDQVQTWEAPPIENPESPFLPFKEGTEAFAPVPIFGQGYRFHITGLTHRPDGFPTNDPKEIERKMLRFIKKMEILQSEILDRDPDMHYEKVELEDADVVIVAIGSVARVAQAAVEDLRSQDIKAGLLRPKVVWPFPEKPLKEIDGNVQAVFVAEMNQGQMVYEVERILKKTPVHKINQFNGMLMFPSKIVEAVKSILR